MSFRLFVCFFSCFFCVWQFCLFLLFDFFEKVGKRSLKNTHRSLLREQKGRENGGETKTYDSQGNKNVFWNEVCHSQSIRGGSRITRPGLHSGACGSPQEFWSVLAVSQQIAQRRKGVCFARLPEIYRKLLPSLGGYLTFEGVLDWKRVGALVAEVLLCAVAD